LMLADRGALDLDAPVVNYWPEFGANGKDRIPVRFLLSHTAGVPGFSRPFSNAELYNWEFACADLASQEPWWEPGIQSGYHAITQGYLIGEVIRRITGRTIGTYFREEVAEKIGVDFHIGVPPSEFNRIADLIPAVEIAPILQMDPDSITARVFAGEMTEGDLTDVTRTDGWRRAEIPAANGHGNARSVVRAQTALANNGRAFGVELLSPGGARKALEPQIDGVDVVLGLSIQFAMGFALPSEGIPISPNANTLWWGGAGGSLIAIDTDAHLCFSYVMNQMDNHIVGDPRGTGLGSALYGCIDG